MTRVRSLTLAAATAALIAGSAPAVAQTRLTIMVFAGMQNLPLFAAQSQGLFAKRGLEVDMKIAPNSDELRNGLAQGRFQVVHAASDNSVAMVEMAGADAKIVVGGDNGMNRLFVQPDIARLEDLRGRTVAVDAPNTAYAFQLYEILRLAGLEREKDYKVQVVGATMKRVDALMADKTLAATMLNPPFSLRAAKGGLKDMGEATAKIGPYQASAGFVLAKWARENSDTLVKYLSAYVEGVRWSSDPKNKAAAIKLVADKLKLPEEVAAAGYDLLMTGMPKDAALDMKGFENVLALRTRHTGKPTRPAADYVDLSYYQKAIAGM
ncbi:ABC transporter substrate-binding protein [Rhodoplanes sp. TEM]|uniref:ABC transporter substrate-binding protein n=1 Tax=Rhodoplanes tepidamans TaxID=200616 RepID=A0ABT5JGN3_RHOTP|nr:MULTISPECIES: ABC transporter substrate-binding protein [Rhodoplanes]MDC7788777.1 ABC transporter substrate-binding protein [Rhodoplanes tepidamans]MDC7984109.1 ABC transporter substrate-binding protein [Rhodoplanes sp. TEM]MDQ0356911.1 ABC-type nitrate/sulfonate/bicarbonate transport system substrate-binding protein [Rhodoplanes tepidamans]